ncbi:uncharacterized protein LOC131640670 [Vicia villosa]|uniref:uncharacterized protein LOC131640670 n=1 Tax=Vicia villosa TaxID=3911 RepID=UPI00273B8069|nr:uncharacterized protein LOC131640670 [Vicia villosa]
MGHYCSLLLVLFFLCVASSNSISTKVIEVDIICKGASNPSYCSNLLNSKPGGAKGVSLVDLAQYTIDVLNGNWVNSTSSRLLVVEKDLKLGQYLDMAKAISEIMQYTLHCRDSLHKSDIDPLLPQYVDVFRQGVEVLEVLSKNLSLG